MGERHPIEGKLSMSVDEARLRQLLHWGMVQYAFGLSAHLLRTSRGWTQAELAATSGVSVRMIVAVEAGDLGKASLSALKSLARAFDVALLVRFEAFSAYLPESWAKEQKQRR